MKAMLVLVGMLACAISGYGETVSVPPTGMVSRIFQVEPHMLLDLDAEGFRALLTKLGVEWPAGSAMRYWPDEGFLTVDNTPKNMVLITSLLLPECVKPKQVEIDLQMVAFPAAEIEKLAIRNEVSVESLTALWAAGSGKLIACPRVLTRSGNEATVRGGREMVYPTDYDISWVKLEGTNVSVPAGHEGPIPQNFETRETGAILSVIPEISPEGNMINLNVRPEWVGMPDWVDYGVEAGDGATPRLPMRQPIFYRYSVETQVTVADGARILMGGGVPGRDPDTLVFTFVTVSRVNVEGGKVRSPRESLRDRAALPE